MASKQGGCRAILVLGLAGVLSAFVGAWHPSAWFDEAATLSAVQRSYGDLADLLGQVDAVHGVYYLVAKVWAGVVGGSLTSLRLLSALGLGATAAATALLVRRLSTHRVGLVSGVAVLLLPGVAWSGVEARSYSWSAALAAGTTYLLAVARQRNDRRGWAAYGVVLTLSNWLFLFAAPLALAHGVALRWTDRHVARGWCVAAACSALGTLPLAVVGFGQRRQVAHIDLALVEVAGRLFGAQAFIGPGFRSQGRSVLLFEGFLVGLVTTTLVASTVARRRHLVEHDPFLVRLLWCWALVPAVTVAGPHLWGAQTYQVRYLTYAMPAVAALVALGATTYEGRGRHLATGVFLLTVVPLLVSQHLPSAKSGEDYRGLAALAQQWDVDDVVFSGAGSRGIRVAYPGRFEHARDLVLDASAARSDTLFGRNVAPRNVRALDVRGRRLLHFQRTIHRRDAFAHRLERLGCRPTSEVERWRFVATLWEC